MTLVPAARFCNAATLVRLSGVMAAPLLLVLEKALVTLLISV